MTARIGYLAALASGRGEHPPLRPPRRLFPPVAVADAELPAGRALGAVEPAPWPPPAEPGAASPGTPAPADPAARRRSVAPRAAHPDAGDHGGVMDETPSLLADMPGSGAGPRPAGGVLSAGTMPGAIPGEAPATTPE